MLRGDDGDSRGNRVPQERRDGSSGRKMEQDGGILPVRGVRGDILLPGGKGREGDLVGGGMIEAGPVTDEAEGEVLLNERLGESEEWERGYEDIADHAEHRFAKGGVGGAIHAGGDIGAKQRAAEDIGSGVDVNREVFVDDQIARGGEDGEMRGELDGERGGVGG